MVLETLVEMDLDEIERKKKKYKDFKETYSLCSIAYVFALLYPNTSNVLKRCIWITIIICLNGGQLIFFTTYTAKSIYNLDVYNFSRNMTLVIVLVLFFFKTYYTLYATPKLAALLQWISRDLIRGNDLSEDYQAIYDEHIRYGKIAENSWLWIPVGLGAMFPVYAGVMMTIESLQTDDFQRYMIHDMDLIFFEDIQDDWPFFHVCFAYNCMQCVVLVPNYCGIDGSFCIATTHLRMKLKLMVHKLRRAYKDARSDMELKRLVTEALKDHQDALEFYDLLQSMYGPWLFAVFMLTSFMITFNLYCLYLLNWKFEPKFMLFIIFGVLHIYWPCNYASTVAQVGDAISLEIYDVPWEMSKNTEVTKMLIIMIARAQKTLIIKGWIVTFDMELFKTILQTSYSFFTLVSA